MGLRQLLVEIARRLTAQARRLGAPTPATHGATSASGRATTAPAPLFVSWLDDARKLRPARPAPPTTVTLSRAALLRPMRFVADTSRAFPREAGQVFGEGSVPTRPIPPVTHAALPEQLPSQPAPTPPEPAQPVSETPDIDFLHASPEALAGLNPEQRMLLRIRYLVRKGVYNEGFTAEIPEQYRHSLGIDEPPRA